jgi:DNA invertase Pin-like site-specific DNA recombinase
VYALYVSRRRLRRKSEKAQRHTRAPQPARLAAPPTIVREATRVERLAYTRTQAAAALGVSRSTFSRRVLPLIETLEMPWGARLIPVDELQRLLTEKRRQARKKAQPAPPGRPAALAPEVADRIRSERAAGKSLAQIARELNLTETPTAHGGAQWWSSTVRAVLRRAHA